MFYNKPSLSCQQQAELLISRGLIADKADLICKLREVNYSRLSSYLDPYFDLTACKFKEGTDFETVWANYTFDRRLRFIVMDAVERIEISLRTKLVNEFSQGYGAFGYLDKQNLPNITNDKFAHWIHELKEASKRGKEPLVQRFFNKYPDNKDLPIWILVEITTFGKLLTFFNGVDANIQKSIAGFYGTTDEVLKSWLLTLNSIRNICAHHSRLWDIVLGVKPKIPKRNKHWFAPIQINNSRVFCVLTMLAQLLKVVAPQSSWKERLFDLFKDYKNIPLSKLGFPKGWEDIDMWKD